MSAQKSRAHAPRDRSFGSLNPLDNVYLAMRMVF